MADVWIQGVAGSASERDEALPLRRLLAKQLQETARWCGLLREEDLKREEISQQIRQRAASVRVPWAGARERQPRMWPLDGNGSGALAHTVALFECRSALRTESVTRTRGRPALRHVADFLQERPGRRSCHSGYYICFQAPSGRSLLGRCRACLNNDSASERKMHHIADVPCTREV